VGKLDDNGYDNNRKAINYFKPGVSYFPRNAQTFSVINYRTLNKKVVQSLSPMTYVHFDENSQKHRFLLHVGDLVNTIEVIIPVDYNLLPQIFPEKMPQIQATTINFGNQTVTFYTGNN
jgi:hypothetical protein